jgi:hypothetical protein
MSDTPDPLAMELDQRQAEQLRAQAKEQGVELVGPNGLLNQLTKNVLETALDAVFVPFARCQTADRAEGVDERCRCEAGVLGSGELEQFAAAVVLKAARRHRNSRGAVPCSTRQHTGPPHPARTLQVGGRDR